MKKVVFLNGLDILKKKMPVKIYKNQAYKNLFEYGREHGFEMAWSSLKYWQGTTFSAYTTLNGGRWEQKRASIKPDFVIDKSYATLETKIKRQIEVKVPFLDPMQVQLLLHDKLLTHLAFPNLVHPSFMVQNRAQLKKILKQFKSTDIVIKPLASSGGRDVNILSKSAGLKFNFKQPMLVQEFIDCSKGVPGLYKGVHDFRLLFMGNELVHAYIRTAASGTLRCNVSLGGGRIIVPLKDVPEKMLEMSVPFQKNLAQFSPIFYSLDFIYKNGRTPTIIEANVKPGLTCGDGKSEHHRILYGKLFEYIKRFV